MWQEENSAVLKVDVNGHRSFGALATHLPSFSMMIFFVT